jgi:hypothetical protein
MDGKWYMFSEMTGMVLFIPFVVRMESSGPVMNV